MKKNISIERAADLTINPGTHGSSDKEGLIVDIRSSWKINYLSWRKKKNFKGLIIKYEDLKQNPFIEFKKILDFLIKKENNKLSDKIRTLELKNWLNYLKIS